MTDTPEIAAETMLGDLTSAVLDEIKQAPHVWDKMSEHDLANAQGETVLIVISSAEQYGGGEKPEADPDQPEMSFDEAGG